MKNFGDLRASCAPDLERRPPVRRESSRSPRRAGSETGAPLARFVSRGDGAPGLLPVSGSSRKGRPSQVLRHGLHSSNLFTLMLQ